MNKEQFKSEYLTNAFFFVKNRYQFEKLQEVGIEFGLVSPTGCSKLIEYDMYNVSTSIAPRPNIKVAKNLTFFPDGRFQKSSFWVRGASYGEPKDFDKFIEDYNSI